MQLTCNLHINQISYNISKLGGNITMSVPFDDTMFVSNTFGSHIYDKINGISNCV